jgi:hypothetical protein
MSHRNRFRPSVLSVALVGLLPSCLGEATIEPADASAAIPPVRIEPGVDAGRDASTDAGKDSGADAAGSCVPTSFTGTMTIAARSGSAPAVGSSCSLTVGPRDSDGFCHVSVLCAGTEWYATEGTANGYLPSCTLTASGFAVGTDPETTSAGNGSDPALALSMTSLSIRDDASGANGTFQFSGTPAFEPVGTGC